MNQQIFDVCVIGAGPAGVAITLTLAERGFSIALIESGTEKKEPQAQQLSRAIIQTPASHSTMHEAVHRGLGGTSILWGGRCVPLDRLDFEVRDHVKFSGWPLSADDLHPFYPEACNFLGVGEADFQVASCRSLSTGNQLLSAKFENDSELRACELERWSGNPNVWHAHREKLKRYPNITVMAGMTCIGFNHLALNEAVSEALVRPTATITSKIEHIAAAHFVIACGGIESTRLILNSVSKASGLKLDAAHLVGRYYMGHLSGKIADIELFGSSRKTVYGFERDGDTYVRRRITLSPDLLSQQKLLNTAFWLDNAPIADPRHGSAVLSAAFLALTSAGLGAMLAPAAIRTRMIGTNKIRRAPHLINCMSSPLSTALFCTHFAYRRYLSKPRLPGFFTHSTTNRYALHFHAEQVPNWESKITLSDEVDAHGMKRAEVALHWSQQDIDSVIKIHQVLDNLLQQKGVGRLVYRHSSNDLELAVRKEAFDGFHQLGSLRMAADAEHGVTDYHGRLFGAENCYVASSAIFPTAGQANPTLALVALALRQAQHIAKAITTREAAHA